MSKSGARKELVSQYKEREVIGGVYVIKNTKNNKLLLAATTDLPGSRNRFAFSQNTGSCVNMALQSDWAAHGANAFVFEVLEELKKTETQTAKEFKADTDMLKDMWAEKFKPEDLY